MGNALVTGVAERIGKALLKQAPHDGHRGREPCHSTAERSSCS